MKRILALTLIIAIMPFNIAICEIDFSSHTDEELKTMLSQISEELNRRLSLSIQSEYGVKIYDNNNIKIYLSQQPYIVNNIYGEPLISTEIVVINESDVNIRIEVEEVFLNNWKLGCYETISVDGGRKAKEKLTFLIYKLDIIGKEEIQSFEMPIEIINTSSYSIIDTIDSTVFSYIPDKR